MSKRPEPKPPTRVRCAIYTRKSSQDGLEQEFNSLDAQRESAEAYIASQKAEGWQCLPDRYDDGGFTGGNMERPALGRLMADIEAGKVDCVVVYKVDRLSRSLIDFARLMELFDRKKISFVSVTQQFNTTQSMGRLADLSAIRFYENGVVSLNLPMSPQVVGSRATRTTHPRVLACMRRLFSEVTGTAFGVENPFLWKTKADVVADIVKAGHGAMIDYSISCTHTRKYRKDQPHCGMCSQCIDRRFAVLAANAAQFEPDDRYRHKLLTDPRDEGESRIMLASYLETAQQVAAMDITAFYNRYGEAVRALPHIDLPVDDAAKRIFDLYKRHGEQIVSAIEAAGKAHMGQIIKRSLPESCTLRLVHDPNPNTAPVSAPPVAGAAEPPPPTHQLVQEGQGWLLRFDGIDKRFALSVGMLYVREMLASPSKRFTVAQLYAMARPHLKDIPSARAEAKFDAKEARAIWVRINELNDEIAAAEKDGNTTAKQVAENEKAKLIAFLQEAKFAGRMKVESADQKRLRDRVRNRVNDTIEIIKKYHPTAGAHIDGAILRGTVMTYEPSDVPPWDF